MLAKSLRILCFGDSLTAGYSASTYPTLHAYAGALETSLKAAYPQLNISTDVQGFLGDQTECPAFVCPGFLPRIEKLYENTPGYDYAIILGGTNDLHWNRTVDNIFTSIQKVWNIALTNHTKVLALTVPECGDCGNETDVKTLALNSNIINHVASNFYTFNLHDSVPYWNMTAAERSSYWDDGIHWTPKGYDLVGGRIAERMLEMLKANNQTNQTQPTNHGGLGRGNIGSVLNVLLFAIFGHLGLMFS
ncbi:related to esterase [Phialocephala subalpina]|uniref:Related to esterase n=1 Tax=Phialocephala subalpina TaxID=576137 RepID=A0A1L7WN14_9HELO|nr:related to esterase [Phialocephala subalpina]